MTNTTTAQKTESTNRDDFPLLELFADTASPASRLVLSTLRSAALLDRIVARSLAPFGLHHAQLNALMLLKRRGPNGIRPSVLGDYLCVSRPNVTKLLTRLKSRALVEERPDPGDGRAVLAIVTPAGEELAEQAWTLLSHDLAQVVDRIPDRTRASLGNLLQEFRDGLAGALNGNGCEGTSGTESPIE